MIVKSMQKIVFNIFFAFVQNTVLILLLLLLIQLFNYNNAKAQELEPRLLSNTPVGMNYLLLGYAYGTGNILLDSSLPIEDLNANLHIVIGAYVRTIDFFGPGGLM